MRAEAPATQPHEIVVGVDGSGPSTNALIWALRTAASRDWTVEAVTAWPEAGAVFVHEVPGHFCQPRQHAYDLQDAALAEALRVVGDEHCVETTIINAPPLEALRKRASSARLVVIGTHRTPSATHAGVVEELPMLVGCPVVVIHDGTDDAAAG